MNYLYQKVKGWNAVTWNSQKACPPGCQSVSWFVPNRPNPRRSPLALSLALILLMPACIPRTGGCGKNDFTCNTMMQLFAFMPGSVVIVGGQNPAALPAYLISRDGGASWIPGTLSGPASTSIVTLNYADGRFLAGTGTTNFFETGNSGATWTAGMSSAANTGAVSHANGQYLVHDTTGGSVWGLPDGGSTWTSLGMAYSSTSPSLFSMGGTLYLLVQGSGLYYYSGGSWTQVSGPNTLESLCVQEPQIYLAEGTGSQVYTTSAGGTFLQALGSAWVTPAPTVSNRYMACNGNTLVVPAGNNCQVVVSTDRGAGWTTVTMPGCGAYTVVGVAFTGSRYVSATTAGSIYVSDDALTWTQAYSGAYNWNAIAVNRAAFFY